MTATSQRGMVRVFLWLVVAAHTATAIPAGAAPETPCVEPTSFWTHDDVLLLDGWGDTGSAATDLIAGYAKLAGQDLVLRFDFLDLPPAAAPNLEIAIQVGPTTPGNTAPFDFEWDLLISSQAGVPTVLDAQYQELPSALKCAHIDHALDEVSFVLDTGHVPDWPGGFSKLQAITYDQSGTLTEDLTGVADPGVTTGRAKLVLLIGNAFAGGGPAGVVWYDGYEFNTDLRPSERRGLRFVLDAAERYQVPLTISHVGIEQLAGNDYLRISNACASSSSKVSPTF